MSLQNGNSRSVLEERAGARRLKANVLNFVHFFGRLSSGTSKEKSFWTLQEKIF